MITRKYPIHRINVKTAGRKRNILGTTAGGVITEFKRQTPALGRIYNAHKIIRLYKTKDKTIEGKYIKRFLLHASNPRGKQRIYEAKKTPSGLTFTESALFSELISAKSPINPGFAHREIYFEDLKGRGLGKRALNLFLAVARKKGLNKVILRDGRKSTLALLANRGFKIYSEPLNDKLEPKANPTNENLKKFNVINDFQLKKFLRNPNTPEVLPGSIYVYFNLRPVPDLKKQEKWRSGLNAKNRL